MHVTDRYLDTPGGALAAAGYVARLRRVGSEVDLDVKSLAAERRGALHRREELSGPAGEGTDPRRWPPGRARDFLLERIGDRPLAEQFTVRQRRRERTLTGEGAEIALSVDRVEVLHGSRAARFAQLEAELRDGDEAVLERLAAELTRYAWLRPEARSKYEIACTLLGVTTARPASTAPPVRVLFVCTGNSARSQMAEALLGQLGGGRFEVASAGTHPKGVDPLTVRALAEIGIDWSAARSKSVEEFLGRPVDHVVTVCDQAREACPVFPGARAMLHWSLGDPAAAGGAEEERLAVFRRIRDEIAGRVRELVEAQPTSSSASRPKWSEG